MYFHSNGFEVNGINDNRMEQGQDYTVDEASLPRPNPNNFLRVTKDVCGLALSGWKMTLLRVISSGRFSLIYLSNFISWR